LEGEEGVLLPALDRLDEALDIRCGRRSCGVEERTRELLIPRVVAVQLEQVEVEVQVER